MRDCGRDYIRIVGSLSYGIIVKQKRMPLLEEIHIADSTTYSGGEKGANQAVQCAKLGIDTTVVRKVGRDAFDDTLVDRPEGYGVGCSCTGRSGNSMGMGVVHVLEDETVYASVITGASFDITSREIDGPDELVRSSRTIILQLEIPIGVVEHIIREAEWCHVYTILNATPAEEMDREVLKMVDCLIVNETGAFFYVGADMTDRDMTRVHVGRLRQPMGGTVIVTLGSKGSIFLGEEGAVPTNPVKMKRAAESTGVGDSCIGAFAYGKLKGMTDLQTCCFVARVTLVTVTEIGTQEVVPCLNEMDGSRLPNV